MRAPNFLITSLSSLGALKTNRSRAKRSPPFLDDLRVPIINIRQEPDVVKTPEFVRRGSQAGRYTYFVRYPRRTLISNSGSGGKLAIYRWRTILVHDWCRNRFSVFIDVAFH
ncbi:hypothetical protein N7G274_010127 [Stereocaulon virgatum]|uniref:Uncharacterized protein n=1 Tax=Stereocaulon virgatum TaxID=373712 RepID=A0ABR3ZWS8_9LECA